MTFYGESERLALAVVSAGTPFSDYTVLRYRAGATTVTAGDVFVAGFWESILLTGADAATFSVVIVVTGGSGVLRLSGGPNPAYDLNDTDASVYSLGDHAVTAGTDLVVELPWVTVADYITETDQTSVMVECLSGSVTIQQVKLRVWPPGGAVGGWSDVNPGFAGAAVIPGAYVQFANYGGDTGASVYGSAATAWGVAVAAFAQIDGDVTSPITLDTSLTFYTGTGDAEHPIFDGAAQGTRSVENLSVIADEWVASLSATASLIMLQGQDWNALFPVDPTALTYGTDWIDPPDEVTGDNAYTVQRIGAGYTEWINAGSAVEITSGEAADPSVTWSADAQDDGVTVIDADTVEAAVPFFDAGAASLSTPSASSTLIESTSLPTDGRFIFVRYSHTTVAATPSQPTSGLAYITTAVAHFGTGDPTGGGFLGIRSRPVAPPYRVWSPTAAVTFMRVMQRGDGLGMGSGRVFNQGTRQGSSKVFGTY